MRAIRKDGIGKLVRWTKRSGWEVGRTSYQYHIDGLRLFQKLRWPGVFYAPWNRKPKPMAILMLFYVIGIASAIAHDTRRPNLDGWYYGLRNPRSGISSVRNAGCCSQTDCHETEAEMRGNDWWARLATRNGDDWDSGPWIKVPDDAILLNQSNPTGNAVICHSMSLTTGGKIDPAAATVFCFVAPTES